MSRAIHDNQATAFITSAKPMWQSSLMFAILTLLCLPFLDLDVTHTSPTSELKLMFFGLIRPNFIIPGLVNSLVNTIVFAVQAVAFSVVIGFFLAQLYRFQGIRFLMSFLRSIHELFWALILIQFFGLTSLTGVLALAIPFSATFARVFAEIQQETSKKNYHQIKGSHFSRFIYTTFPLALPRLANYCRYRLECALRASVVLGFIGLPTIGFQLEGYLKLGQYQEVSALIFIFIGLVLTMRLWANRFALPILFLFSIIWLPPTTSTTNHEKNDHSQIDESVWKMDNVSRFIDDITPAPLKNTDDINDETSETITTTTALWQWFYFIFETQILPGLGYTLLLGQFAFAFSAFLGLLLFPVLSKHMIKQKHYRRIGNLALTSLRCLPELLLAFIALIILGPSLLPGILALGIHNGVLIAHLVGLHSNEFNLRNDKGSAPNTYFFELLPRIYGQFLSFTSYRGETILRETAILGILGIPTLGFFIDSAFEEFRLDRAVLLILASALLNIFAEIVATKCRKYIHAHKPSQAESSPALNRN
jgi:phosphonate transport system permease protein